MCDLVDFDVVFVWVGVGFVDGELDGVGLVVGCCGVVVGCC